MIALEKATKPLKGDIFVPGDKSISHRSIMFGAISKGTTVRVVNLDSIILTVETIS